MTTNTYPRESGHCATHHISADVVTLKEENNPTRDEMDLALKYLQDQNADLIKGDLVIFDSCAGYRNTGVTIFTGEEIVDLAFEPDDYGNLPQQFHVIEDGVPINYWSHLEDNVQGITHNSIVWFDHSQVLDECLRHITYELVEGDKYAIFTHFTYFGKKYRIVFDYVDHLMADNFINSTNYGFLNESNVQVMKDLFHRLLSNTEELIAFDYWTEFYPDFTGNNTLFLPYDSLDEDISESLVK